MYRSTVLATDHRFFFKKKCRLQRRRGENGEAFFRRVKVYVWLERESQEAFFKEMFALGFWVSMKFRVEISRNSWFQKVKKILQCTVFWNASCHFRKTMCFIKIRFTDLDLVENDDSLKKTHLTTGRPREPPVILRCFYSLRQTLGSIRGPGRSWGQGIF